jgi:hypothetical protein
MAALLGEGDVVEDDDALGALEGAGPLGSGALEDLGMVPGAVVDERWQGLILVLDDQPVRQGDPAGARRDAVAVAVEEQPWQVDGRP